MKINTVTDLMHHQEEAAIKLLPIKVGALFMDMGTGKSRTVIELAKARFNRGKINKIIWLSPVSLKQTVRQEIEKHTGTDAHTYVFDSKTNQTTVKQDSIWYCVGIESLSSSDRIVFTVNDLIDQKTMVIVDESSYIKGHKSKRTDRITKLSEKARYRTILTGTPFSQGPEDLYAQMRFLSSKILGYRSFYSFANNHLEYSDKYPGMIVRTHNSEWLASKIKPYVYQVTKAECLNLPNKVHVHRHYDMSDEQQEAAQTIKEDIFLEMSDYESQYGRSSSILIFKLFNALQQVSCGYYNDTDTGKLHEYQHGRLNLLQTVINEIAPEEPIIIWAKYHYDIKHIVKTLTESHEEEQITQFHGKLNEQQRAEQVEKFRQGAKFFIATQSAGGHGLTLNESCYTLFYNSNFKYAEHIQAQDRNHRIGQYRKVTYINLWSDAGIEDRIYHALESKGNALKVFREEVEKIKEQKKGKKGKLKQLINSM